MCLINKQHKLQIAQIRSWRINQGLSFHLDPSISLAPISPFLYSTTHGCVSGHLMGLVGSGGTATETTRGSDHDDGPIQDEMRILARAHRVDDMRGRTGVRAVAGGKRGTCVDASRSIRVRWFVSSETRRRRPRHQRPWFQARPCSDRMVGTWTNGSRASSQPHVRGGPCLGSPPLQQSQPHPPTAEQGPANRRPKSTRCRRGSPRVGRLRENPRSAPK